MLDAGAEAIVLGIGAGGELPAGSGAAGAVAGVLPETDGSAAAAAVVVVGALPEDLVAPSTESDEEAHRAGAVSAVPRALPDSVVHPPVPVSGTAAAAAADTTTLIAVGESGAASAVAGVSAMVSDGAIVAGAAAAGAVAPTATDATESDAAAAVAATVTEVVVAESDNQRRRRKRREAKQRREQALAAAARTPAVAEGAAADAQKETLSADRIESNRMIARASAIASARVRGTLLLQLCSH